MNEPLLRPGFALDPDQKNRLAGLLVARGEVNGIELVGVVTVYKGALWWRKPAGYSAYIRYMGMDFFSDDRCRNPREAIVNCLAQAEYPNQYLKHE